MKDAEDEAFDELAKRQGAWGGGFKAKQDMAMHKTQDQNICRHYKQWQHCHICDLESQAAELAGIKAILDEYGLQAIDFVADFKAALAQPAQEPVTEREALKLALEALEESQTDNDTMEFWDRKSKAITAIRQALAQPPLPVQEPVAWMYDWFCDGKLITGWIAHSESEIPKSMALNIRPLYTAPPQPAQREWVGLTEKDFSAINQSCLTKLQAATSAESILKEKNS